MKKRIWILSMFKHYFDPFKDLGVIGSTLKNERECEVEFEINIVHLPEFSKKGFKGVDASPYGGGVGMVMRADVLKNAIIEGVVKAGGYDENHFREKLHIVYPAPRGETWNQEKAMDFGKKYFSVSESKDLVFICGRYEGIDERFIENYVDEHISIGNFILTGGELAVMTILDSALRFSPGVLGNKLSAYEESFFNNKIEHALYTRPKKFEEKEPPAEVLSGNHKYIQEFKEESSKVITKIYRKDLSNGKF